MADFGRPAPNIKTKHASRMPKLVENLPKKEKKITSIVKEHKGWVAAGIAATALVAAGITKAKTKHQEPDLGGTIAQEEDSGTKSSPDNSLYQAAYPGGKSKFRQMQPVASSSPDGPSRPTGSMAGYNNSRGAVIQVKGQGYDNPAYQGRKSKFKQMQPVPAYAASKSDNFSVYDQRRPQGAMLS